MAQKVKLSGKASFEAKNGTLGVISQKCLLKLECRGLRGVHFCFRKIFFPLPWKKISSGYRTAPDAVSIKANTFCKVLLMR